MSLPIVFATFNIRNSRGLDGRNSWPLRRQTFRKALLDLNADIIGLQEVRPPQLRFLKSILSSYSALSQGRDDGKRRGEHCTILFRNDRFVAEQYTTRWFSDTPEVPGSRGWGNRSPRIVSLVVLCEKSSGNRFLVANTHLDEASVDSRLKSTGYLAEFLLTTANGLPIVLLGDLNAAPDQREIQILLEAGLQDTLRLPPSGPGIATHHRFTGKTTGTRIDYVLVSGAWDFEPASIVRADGIRHFASDHWPVVANVRLRPDRIDRQTEPDAT